MNNETKKYIHTLLKDSNSDNDIIRMYILEHLILCPYLITDTIPIVLENFISPKLLKSRYSLVKR